MKDESRRIGDLLQYAAEHEHKARTLRAMAESLKAGKALDSDLGKPCPAPCWVCDQNARIQEAKKA